MVEVLRPVEPAGRGDVDVRRLVVDLDAGREGEAGAGEVVATNAAHAGEQPHVGLGFRQVPAAQQARVVHLGERAFASAVLRAHVQRADADRVPGGEGVVDPGLLPVRAEIGHGHPAVLEAHRRSAGQVRRQRRASRRAGDRPHCRPKRPAQSISSSAPLRRPAWGLFVGARSKLRTNRRLGGQSEGGREAACEQRAQEGSLARRRTGRGKIEALQRREGGESARPGDRGHRRSTPCRRRYARPAPRLAVRRRRDASRSLAPSLPSALPRARRSSPRPAPSDPRPAHAAAGRIRAGAGAGAVGAPPQDTSPPARRLNSQASPCNCPIVPVFSNDGTSRGRSARSAALAQPVRLEVFRALVVAGEQRTHAGQRWPRAWTIPANTLSFHLKELANAGLVTQERPAETSSIGPPSRT